MNKFNATDFLEKYNNLLAEEFKDVEFAGLLCVKEKSNGNGYTYFNIDLAGNAISRFKVKEDCLNFNVFKDDKNVEVVQNSQSKILTKPNVVEVIRYFRIWDFELLMYLYAFYYFLLFVFLNQCIFPLIWYFL